MDKHLLVVSNSSVAFSWVFLTAMEKESGCDSFPDLAEVLSFHVSPSGGNRQFEALHDHHQLLANILSSLDRTSLDEILVTPGVLVAILFPGLINCEQSQVVSVLLIKLSSLLISKVLFLSRPIEHVLD
jgi:hypothetical protein